MDFTDKCKECRRCMLTSKNEKYCAFDQSIVLGDIIHCENFRPIEWKKLCQDNV